MHYLGDEDAPRVIVISEPRLGPSMDLPETDEVVWSVLADTARTIAEQVDVFAIACNTLNIYAARLEALALPADLVTPQAAVGEWCHQHDVTSIGLLGARPVTRLDAWSPYTAAQTRLTVEPPPDIDALHQLILDIKRDGGVAAHQARFATLAAAFSADHLVLACTELPLVSTRVPGKTLLDPTDLLAAALVRRWSASTAS
ncbi:MAG: aspartate racemase [Candidatus Aldehydirespiratoraceae bacterium]